MKKKSKNASALLFWFSVIMIIIMVVHSVIDYKDYLRNPYYSAPFSANLIVKCVTYGIPIVIGFILSAIFKIKANRH